ncbi:MAG: hypothetical protein SOY06_01835 [Prevotella sp.]|nr:hypothetical protein [Bacteroidales bacterium]MDY4228578.1 hypothetical protein [Prevotella sp.]
MDRENATFLIGQKRFGEWLRKTASACVPVDVLRAACPSNEVLNDGSAISDTEISLQKLAEAVGSNTEYVSQVINELGCSI